VLYLDYPELIIFFIPFTCLLGNVLLLKGEIICPSLSALAQSTFSKTTQLNYIVGLVLKEITGKTCENSKADTK